MGPTKQSVWAALALLNLISVATGLHAVAPQEQATATRESVAPELSPERTAILAIAEGFATVRWRAEKRHAFHGDHQGVRIDTPDISFEPGGWKPEEENVGMPYCWGGFTSLTEFEEQLKGAGFAGHVPLKGNARGSRSTVGVDCSGYVSRCWSLPLKQSTRSLGALCYELADYSELEPGDIVNRFDGHVALFEGWGDEQRTKMNVYEAARLRVKESSYSVEQLRKNNFRPMRYKLLDERWQPMPTPTPGKDTVVAPRERFAFIPSGEAWVGDDPMPAALREGATLPGDWARYAVDERWVAGGEVHRTWMAVAGDPRRKGTMELQRLLTVGSDSIATGGEFSIETPWPEVLAAFGCFSNPLQDYALESRVVETGLVRSIGREWPARKVTAVVRCNMLSRSTLYPTRLDLEFVLSDSVPLMGVVSAQIRMEVDYGMQGEERLLAEDQRRYSLLAFGRR